MAQVLLKSVGTNKVKVIQVVRELTGYGLKEAKDFVDAAETQPMYLELPRGCPEKDAAMQLNMVGAVAEYEAIGNENYNEPNTRITVLGKCPFCGAERSEGENFCSYCGSKFDDSGSNQMNESSETSSLSDYVPYEKIEDDNVVRIDPNLVGNLQRDDLLKVLNDIKAITVRLDSCFDNIFYAKSQIEKANQEADSIRNARSGWVGIVDAVFMLFIIILSITMGGAFFIVLILGIICVVLIHKQLLVGIDETFFSDKKEKKAKAYLDSIVPKNEEIIRKSQAEIQSISESASGRWAIDIVGKELFNSEAITMLVDIVSSRRADNLKEALNKYDSMQHSSRMEQMQAAIQNASELTAEESAKQTAYAQQIEKNTHEAATAAKATAYHTRKINRNVRRIERRTR